MASLLTKRLSSLSRSSHSHCTQQLPFLFPLLRSSLSTQTPPQKELPFIADYLVSSLGFSPDRALKCCNYSSLASIKSLDRPEAVIKFLKDTGLSDAQVKAAVTFTPILLGYSVDRILKPNVRKLTENGFSKELLVQLIRYNPTTLLLKDTLSRLLFWRAFVGDSNENLLKIIQRNNVLITFDIEKGIVPKINLFKEYGFSNQDIMAVLQNGYNLISRNVDILKQNLDIVEDLGIPRGSRMFKFAFIAIGFHTREGLLKKLNFFKATYGWSEDEVRVAFKKCPHFLVFSEEKVKSKMDFLITNAKLDPRSIALSPTLLTLSLERRLAPRHRVLSILQAKGLKERTNLLNACKISEKDFLEKFVVPYKESVPEIARLYPVVLLL